MKRMVATVATSALALGLLSACTTDYASNSYSTREIGEARRTERGQVESYRWVEIDRRSGGGGALVGAGAGAGVGAAAGGGSTEGVVIGAILGGLIGNAVEDGSNEIGGFEYLIRTDSGSTVSIVQADKTPLPKGAPVLMIFGRERTRVILDEARITSTQPLSGG